MLEQSGSASPHARVVIAGGGFAALEAALALRALAKDHLELALISPSDTFVYRPAATIEAFTAEPPPRYDLREISADIRMTYHRGALQAVAAESHWVRLTSGKKLEYDRLILAVGARARTAIPGAFAFRDQRDIPRFKMLIDDLNASRVRRVSFAVPSLESWALPVYELALMAAMHARRGGARPEISIVSPEPAPLAVFGHDASRLVSELLADRAISFVGRTLPHSVRRDGSLALQFESPIAADRVVAVPDLHGPRITGIPANWSGFVPTDGFGRVEGLDDVYAAGDMTTYPIKQGGLAAQQADLIAHEIASQLGAAVKDFRPTRALRARLLDGAGALVLRTELDGLGRPTRSTLEHHESRHAPDLKVFGLYLTPYLSIYRSRVAALA